MQVLTYGDNAVITQVDDGQPEGPGLVGAMQTSSASAPDIVAVMLAALDAHPDHRVLEIGTGTGYNAALLAHRLGAEQVSSVEIDSHVQRASVWAPAVVERGRNRPLLVGATGTT